MMNNSTFNSPLLSIVIPLYCEASHLKEVLLAIQKALKPLDCLYELILVDDGSTDNTWATIEKETKNLQMFKALRLSRNFGKEAALCAGLEVAEGSAVILLDGDLEHPPELIPEMVHLWRKSNADVVEAVKIKRGKESVINKIGARIFYTAMNKLSGYELNDATDYKLMDRKVVNAWLKMGERNLFFRGMIAWLGFKRMQVTFAVPKRVGGTSKWSMFRLIRLAVTAMTAFSSLPLHIVTFLGYLFLIFAIILGAQTLYLNVVGEAVSGFTTVILLQLIIGSVLMICLGIIGEYIARIYEEVKGRPRYVVAQTIDKTSND